MTCHAGPSIQMSPAVRTPTSAMNAITNPGSAFRRSPCGRARFSSASDRAIHIAAAGTSTSSPKVRMNFVSPATATVSGASNCCA